MPLARCLGAPRSVGLAGNMASSRRSRCRDCAGGLGRGEVPPGRPVTSDLAHPVALGAQVPTRESSGLGGSPPRAAQTRAACSQPPRRTAPSTSSAADFTGRDGTGPARHGPTAPGPHLQHRAGRAAVSRARLAPRSLPRGEASSLPVSPGARPCAPVRGAAPAQPRACAPASRNAEEAPPPGRGPRAYGPARPRRRRSPRPLPSPAQAPPGRAAGAAPKEKQTERAKLKPCEPQTHTHTPPTKTGAGRAREARAREGTLGRQGPAGLPGRRPGSRGHGEPERRQQDGARPARAQATRPQPRSDPHPFTPWRRPQERPRGRGSVPGPGSPALPLPPPSSPFVSARPARRRPRVPTAPASPGPRSPHGPGRPCPQAPARGQAAREEPASVASASGTDPSGPARPSALGPRPCQPPAPGVARPRPGPARPRTHSDRARRGEAKTDDNGAAPRADWPRSLPRLTPWALSGPGPAAAAAGSRPRGRAARARRPAEARAPRSAPRVRVPLFRLLQDRACAPRDAHAQGAAGSAPRSRGGRRAGARRARGRWAGLRPGKPCPGREGRRPAGPPGPPWGALGRRGDTSPSPNRKRGGSGRPGPRPSRPAPESAPPASGSLWAGP